MGFVRDVAGNGELGGEWPRPPSLRMSPISRGVHCVENSNSLIVFCAVPC